MIPSAQNHSQSTIESLMYTLPLALVQKVGPVNIDVPEGHRNNVKSAASHRFFVFVPVHGTRSDHNSR